ncbi:MAG: AAA family ATPase, partial [Pseudomonadota bacterium]
MSNDLMQLTEKDIEAQYPQALALLEGFDHRPQIAKARETRSERSSGIGTRRRFRSTTPGLVARSTAPAAGIALLDRIESMDAGDALPSPLQASALRALRRALAISLVVAEQYAQRTPLAGLKRINLAGEIKSTQQTDFEAYLSAEALIALFVFGSSVKFQLSDKAGDAQVEIVGVEEFLTTNASEALEGALWELD